MTDCFAPSIRSKVMKAVRSHGNLSTELNLAKIFRKNLIIGWRRRVKLIGNPDFVFPKKKIAVFADGCFWHGHNCRNLKPQAHRLFWKHKISKNKLRDHKTTLALRRLGWNVIRVWECEINGKGWSRKIDLLRV
jgi:DNA mismatch endonuclease (patch repair protein)